MARACLLSAVGKGCSLVIHHSRSRTLDESTEDHGDPFASFSRLSRELSDLEFSLIVLVFGFSRWVQNCMDATAFRGLSALDVLVLHAVNHRARGRRPSEISSLLNIDDTHLVAYSLKKLVAAELVTVARRGRERCYETSAAGDDACLAYRQIREKYLVDGLRDFMSSEVDLGRIGGFMRVMTGLYDQAGRLATADAQGRPKAPPLRTKPSSVRSSTTKRR